MSIYLYRFRSTEALLGKYQELENQEIYFASSKELNDPLEGFTNIFWRGDEILWKNLLDHYVLCLMHAVFDARLHGPDHKFKEDQTFVFNTPEHLPTLEFKELYCRVCEIFFQPEDIAQLPVLLSMRKTPIRRYELIIYLQLLHLHALNAVTTAMGEHQQIPPRPIKGILHAASINPIPFKDWVELLNFTEVALDQPDFSEAVSTVSVAKLQMELISKYKGILLEDLQAWKIILYEFPSWHVSQLEQLLYSEWYAACFVECPMQAAMWGNYGDEHKGVCLKFKTHPNKDGNPAIKMRQSKGKANKDESGPTYRNVELKYYKVEYVTRLQDIDFFRSLGRLTESQFEWWCKDASGNASPIVSDIMLSQDLWHEQYWNCFEKATTTKLADWSYEKEYRLTLCSSFNAFQEASSRKMIYHFEDLQGLIFGIRTSTEHKLNIIHIIEEKCKKTQRNDFELYQAYYSHSTGKIELANMGLIRLT